MAIPIPLIVCGICGIGGGILYRQLKNNKKKGILNIGLWGRKGAGKTTFLQCCGAEIPDGQTLKKISFDNIEIVYKSEKKTISVNNESKDDKKCQDYPGDKLFRKLLNLTKKEYIDKFIYIFDVNKYLNSDLNDNIDWGARYINADLQKLWDTTETNCDIDVILLATHFDEISDSTEDDVRQRIKNLLETKAYSKFTDNLIVINLKEENVKEKILDIIFTEKEKIDE